MPVNKAVVISGIATAIIVVVVSIPIILSNSGAGKDLWMGNHGEMESIVAGPCVKTFFGKWGLIKPENYEEPKSKPYIAFANTDPDAGEAKGCLIVNWKKKTNVVENPATDKSNVGWWKGFIRWELTLYRGDEGFVFAGGASNGKSDTKLDINIKLTGLKKKGKSWVVEYYHEKTMENVGTADDEKKFPRGFRSQEFKGGKINNSLRSWGFTPWYERSCKWDDNDENIQQHSQHCKFPFWDSPEVFKNRWEWEEKASGGHTFSQAHSNFDTLWSTNFKDNINLDNAKNLLGIWRTY